MLVIRRLGQSPIKLIIQENQMPLLTSFLWREKLVSKIIFCLAKIAISLYFSGAPSRIRTECEPRRTEKKVCVILEGCRFLRYQIVLTKKVYQNDTPLGAPSRIRTECEPRRTEKKVCVILEGCRFLRYQIVLTKKVYQNDTPLGATSDKVSEPTTSPSWCGLYADANLF